MLPGLAGFFWFILRRTNCNAGFSWVFWLFFDRNKSYGRILVTLSSPLLAVTTPSCRVLVAFSRLSLAVTKQFVLPRVGGFFWTSRGRYKKYFRVLVAFSGPFLAAYCGISVAFSGWLSLCHVKSHCRFSKAFSSLFLAIKNRTAGSRWLFLVNSKR